MSGSREAQRPARATTHFTISPLAGAGFICLATFALYFNALSNGFVYDDAGQVLANPWIRSIGSVREIFTSNAWGFAAQGSNYYRPMMHVFYMAAYAVFGLNPWGFHLLNIGIHAGVSVLVFLTARRLLDENEPRSLSLPLMSGLLFAAHPIHTEAVTWIGGIPELSYTLFCLASFSLYMGLDSESRPSFRAGYLLSLAFFFLAALCKETALVLPAILMLCDHVRRGGNERLRDRMKGYVPFFAVAGVYALLRYHALPSLAPVRRHTELSGYEYFINIFPLLKDYMEKLILPAHLSVFHTFKPVTTILDGPAIAGIFVTLVLLVVLALFHRRSKKAFFFMALMLIPLVPVFYIPALGENPFAERYLYLPSLGFVLLLSLGVRSLTGAKPRSSVFVWFAVCIVVVIYAAGVIGRNPDWKSEHTLWEDAVQKSPDAPIAHYNFGLILYGEGDFERAIEHYQAALRLKPSPRVYNDLGLAYGSVGLSESAIETFESAIQLNPEFAEAHNNLGVAYIGKGMYARAIEHLRIAVRIKPGYSAAFNNLGLSFQRMGDTEEALKNYRIAVQLDPASTTARNNLEALSAK